MDVKKNTVLIIAIIILVGTLSFVVGYMYLSGPNNQQNPVNVTPLNDTVTNGTQIPYSSEYITFSKAKSIAKNYASNGVTVSDPILIKDKSGQAVYICSYMYNGNSVGGIILNAKTGAVIYKELNIPSNLNTDTSNDYNYDYQDTNTDNNYNDQNNDYSDDNSDDYYYDDQNSDYYYDEESTDDSGDYYY